MISVDMTNGNNLVEEQCSDSDDEPAAPRQPKGR